jgi:hypothetical protein
MNLLTIKASNNSTQLHFPISESERNTIQVSLNFEKLHPEYGGGMDHFKSFDAGGPDRRTPLGDATSAPLLSAFGHTVEAPFDMFVHCRVVPPCVLFGEGIIRLFVVDTAFKMAMSTCCWLAFREAVDKILETVAGSIVEVLESFVDITVEGTLGAIG